MNQLLSHPIINIANLLSASNLLLGLFSIICTLNGKIDIACYALLIAMGCDFLDGFAARFFKTEGPLGKQLDSLADIVSFGIAPGALLFVMIIVGVDLDSLDNSQFVANICPVNYDEFVHLKISQWVDSFFYNPKDSVRMFMGCPISMESNIYDASIKYLPFVAFIIPLFAMFRLAKFNIDENQSKKFKGLATPMMTFFILFFPLFFNTHKENWFELPLWLRSIFDCYFLATIGLVVALLMLIPIPMLNLKFRNLNFKENIFKFLFLLTSLISIILLNIMAIPIIVLLYFVASIGELIYIKNEI